MENKKWGFWLLTAFVVGNMVGSGILMLPGTLANTASPLGVTSAWLVTGLGVLMIALVFGNLSVRKPHLTAGPQSYAQDMFKNPKASNVAGFSMVWGYWVANWASNVTLIITFAGYLSSFFPILQDKGVLFNVGSFQVEVGKLTTFLFCTAMLWGINWILTRSVNNGGRLYFVATAAKVLGFAFFIIAVLFVFNASNFGDFYTAVEVDGESHGLFGQINLAAISTLWAFIGVESAVILSGRAKSANDVRKATIVGLFIALSIYLAITLLTMGALPQDILKASDRPLVDALNAVIGSGGANFMAILALISLFGTVIGWILMSAEVPFRAAQSGTFPAFLGKLNDKGSPSRALTATNLCSQLFVFSTISGTIAEAFNFVILVATLAYLIPYLVSAIYQLKLVFTGETYERSNGSRAIDGIIAALALIYSLWVIKTGTGDLKTFSLGIGLFVVGFIIYPFLGLGKKKV